MEQDVEQDWYNFYKNRVSNAGYEKHFYSKYGLTLLSFLNGSLNSFKYFNDITIVDLGCGIGSVFKSIFSYINNTNHEFKNMFPHIEGLIFNEEKNVNFICTDINKKMLELTKKNLTDVNINHISSLFNIDYELIEIEKAIIDHAPKNTIFISHGVLEHFEDSKLLKINKLTNLVLNHYYAEFIHYVPLNGYERPSFGDERLMSAIFWEMLFDDSNDKYDIISENYNNKDLFIKKTLKA